MKIDLIFEIQQPSLQMYMIFFYKYLRIEDSVTYGELNDGFSIGTRRRSFGTLMSKVVEG